MRLHCLNLFVAAIIMFLGAATAQANVLVKIDKSNQRMTVTVDGAQRYAWPVSTGGSGYDTPSGDYTPFRMEKDHFSREWDDAPMPNSIFFTKIGHAIHGTFETKNLGRPVSHGCVRLSRANAETLFALVKQEGMSNTRVVLDGQIPDYDKNPTVARRRPFDLNASGHNDRLSAKGGQNFRDDDAYSADDDYRGYRYYRDYPEYRDYREPRRRYNRGVPFQLFLFGQ